MLSLSLAAPLMLKTAAGPDYDLVAWPDKAADRLAASTDHSDNRWPGNLG